MSDLKGMAYLRRRLLQKRARVQTRYKYYEMKNAVKDFGMVTPPEFRTFTEVLGWCGKAVDSLADRLLWREFRDDNFDLNTIYCMNNADVLFDSAVLSALISSCCFVYISQAENGMQFWCATPTAIGPRWRPTSLRAVHGTTPRARNHIG